MFIPRVKSEKMSGKAVELKLPCKVYFCDAQSKAHENVFSDFMPYLNFVGVDKKEDASFIFELRPGISDKSEYYEISSENGNVFASAKDSRGVINAIATLSQMIFFRDGKFYLSEGVISDYPDKPFRSFMVDTGRKYIPIDEFKAQLLLMAKAKMNKLHWHITDGKGCPVLFNSYPELISPDAEGRKYTRDEVSDIVEYAAKFKIDIIPEIDIPGHSYAIIKALPKLACKTGGNVNGWCTCISNEDTYEFIRNILTEVSELFPYEYIHIGTDEIDMRDVKFNNGNSAEMQDWECCELCNKRFGKMGLNTVTERFYYFLKRTYDIVTSLGKKVMMWNDNIDISVSPDLPRDILIEFWRVAAPMRGPREGCSMQRFIDEGFEVVNADYPNTYIDLPQYVNWEKLKKWNLTVTPADAKEKAHSILGAEMCAWDVNEHFEYSLYTAIPAFADRVYNLNEITDEEGFKVALTRFTLGASTPAGLNIFGKYLKDIILTNEDCLIFSPECDKNEFASLLNSLDYQCSYEKFAKDAYIKRISMK